MIGIIRLDGLSPMIMYGTGARFTHCTTLIWIDGELNVIESQGSEYWPKQAIQRTPFKQWLKLANSRNGNCKTKSAGWVFVICFGGRKNAYSKNSLTSNGRRQQK